MPYNSKKRQYSFVWDYNQIEAILGDGDTFDQVSIKNQRESFITTVKSLLTPYEYYLVNHLYGIETERISIVKLTEKLNHDSSKYNSIKQKVNRTLWKLR
jgi:hypothetical protein